MIDKFTNLETYLNGFDEETKLNQTDQNEVKAYIESQREVLCILIAEISQENFWEVFPQILGIDSRLSIIFDLIKFDEFSSGEIISLAEKDYKNYYKELCGYSRGDQSYHTIIFNVTWKY